GALRLAARPGLALAVLCSARGGLDREEPPQPAGAPPPPAGRMGAAGGGAQRSLDGEPRSPEDRPAVPARLRGPGGGDRPDTRPRADPERLGLSRSDRQAPACRPGALSSRQSAV